MQARSSAVNKLNAPFFCPNCARPASTCFPISRPGGVADPNCARRARTPSSRASTNNPECALREQAGQPGQPGHPRFLSARCASTGVRPAAASSILGQWRKLDRRRSAAAKRVVRRERRERFKTPGPGMRLLLMFHQRHNVHRPAQNPRPKTRVVDDLMHGAASERR